MRLTQLSRRAILLPATSVAILLAACGGRIPTQAPNGTVLVAAGSTAATTRMDRADILGATVDGDRLQLRIRHAGGCAEHDFSLLHSGVFVETEPVQIYLQLAHNAHGDPCRALVSRDVLFDLSPLKQTYASLYGRNRGTIVIHLRAPGGGESLASPLRYEF